MQQQIRQVVERAWQRFTQRYQQSQRPQSALSSGGGQSQRQQHRQGQQQGTQQFRQFAEDVIYDLETRERQIANDLVTYLENQGWEVAEIDTCLEACGLQETYMNQPQVGGGSDQITLEGIAPSLEAISQQLEHINQQIGRVTVGAASGGGSQPSGTGGFVGS